MARGKIFGINGLMRKPIANALSINVITEMLGNHNLTELLY